MLQEACQGKGRAVERVERAGNLDNLVATAYNLNENGFHFLKVRCVDGGFFR